MTRLLSLPCSRRTPAELPNRPQPYPNTDVASSPTFALVNEYTGRLTVEHFDMYRVDSWDDLYSTGFFDYLGTDCVLVIAFPVRKLFLLPAASSSQPKLANY